MEAAPPIFDLPQDQLSALAWDAGFDLAGIVAVAPEQQGSSGHGPADYAPENYLEQWIAAGHAGEMEYLKRRNAEGMLLRSSVPAALRWAQSVIVCAANYHADGPLSIDSAPATAGWIARYAWAGEPDPATGELRPADYHDTLLRRLRMLESALHQRIVGSFESRCYVDTGPLIERDLAARAGIGWTGKNTCTLNQQLGSFFFLGAIVTSLAVAPGSLPMPAADRCGTCRRCIDACPTEALIAPRQMDASRCIGYLTIEKRGTILEALRPPMGRHVFGCDICQDVCPWNRRAPVSANRVRPELVNPPLDWLGSLSSETFNQLFRGSPVKRTKRAGLLRNVAIAMGNSGDPSYRAQLEAWAAGEDPVLAEAAAWSLTRIKRSQQE
jgi:epoxyqueuosine reductase